MRVVKVFDRFFEVNGNLKVGEIVKAGDCLGVVVSVVGEEPEYAKYIGELSRDEIKAYMPDILERTVVSRCYILKGMGENVSPEVGEEVCLVSDEDLKKFHTKDGEFRMPYFYNLLKTCDIDITKKILLRLKKVFENEEIIDILIKEVEYMMMHHMK